MNLENLDLANVKNPYFNNIEPEPRIENPQIYDLNMFITENDVINVIEEEEKDLKYNKYNYEYNMANQNTDTNKNLEGLNNLASLGINLVGSLIDTATPLVQDISNKMKEFEDKVNDDFNKRTNFNSSLSKKPVYFKNEDENYLYFVVELPRVKKEDCEIKFLKSENSIQVLAKTESILPGFSFVENKEFELKIQIPENVSITGNSIEASHKNGALYISISKSLINLNNININISN